MWNDEQIARLGRIIAEAAAQSPSAAQARAEHAEWIARCVALGASKNKLERLEADAERLAHTTIQMNAAVVAIVRREALEALLRGETLPADAASAVEAARQAAILRLIGGPAGFGGPTAPQSSAAPAETPVPE